MEKFQGLLGVLAFIGIGYAMSNNRKAIHWQTIGAGILTQIIFALFVLKTPYGQSVFGAIATGVTKLLDFSKEGANFVFGSLATGSLSVGDLSKKAVEEQSVVNLISSNLNLGFIFAFQILPTIIFVSAFMSVLYHLNIMQVLVKLMAWVMRKIMKLSGPESLSVAANTFVGQTEAPLIIKPYVGKMTTSELMTLMVGGFATIAGGVLAAYIGFLGGDDPIKRVEFAKHLIAASVMSAPAAIVMAKLMIPETEDYDPKERLYFEKNTTNVIDAAASGAADGLTLALNVAGMLMAFIALVAFVNAPLGWIGSFVGVPDLNLTKVLGIPFSVFAWLMGIPFGKECIDFGSLLGTKVAVNEFLAYLNLGGMAKDGLLSFRSELIATYALCGFANFSSIAIQIGGIGGIAPHRKHDLAKIGLKAMIGGAFASWMTASIAGIII
ncbi:NupC/NupG family nucleoside CNT transporter [bacterium]|nr:NupC/NupG family nucleoside CNT transporter [bacterium]